MESLSANKAWSNYLIIFTLVGNVLIQFINTLKGIFAKGLEFGDYLWIWKENVYTVHGIDVVEAIKNHMIIDGVDIPATSSTMPYARILANLIHPGFLEKDSAIVYGVVLYLIAIVVAVAVMYRAVKREFALHGHMILFLIVLLTLSPWYWVDGILTWNNGVCFSMLMIISVFIVDEHEIGAGTLLALAMIKPQIAGIFFVSFLIKKKYKAVITSCTILLASWIIYLIYVGGNPVTQMLEMLEQADTKMGGFLWFGIFDFLMRFEVPGVAVILGSMVAGIGTTVFLSIWVIKKELDCNIIYYSIPALISTVWCYKSTSDLVILVLPCLLCVFIMEMKMKTCRELVITVMYLFVLNAKTFCGLFRRIIGYNWLVGVNLDAYARVVMFLLMLLLLNSINEKRGLGC